MSQCKPVPAHHCFWWTSELYLPGTEARRGEIRNQGFFFHLWGAVCPSHFCFSLYLSLEKFLLLIYTTLGPICRLQIFRPPEFSVYWLSFPIHDFRIWSSIFPSRVRLHESFFSLLPCFTIFMTFNIYLLSIFLFECKVHKDRDTKYLVPRTMAVTW